MTRKRGSIALARQLCYEIAGATSGDDDISGSDYGSVDVAEILSAEVERLREALAQPEQEPVAYYHPRSGFYWAKPTSIFAPTSVDVERLPLYTAPPAAQRPWVGLTDEEFIDAWHWGGCNPHIEGAHFKALYYYFEAKLKERNK